MEKKMARVEYVLEQDDFDRDAYRLSWKQFLELIGVEIKGYASDGRTVNPGSVTLTISRVEVEYNE